MTRISVLIKAYVEIQAPLGERDGDVEREEILREVADAIGRDEVELIAPDIP